MPRMSLPVKRPTLDMTSESSVLTAREDHERNPQTSGWEAPYAATKKSYTKGKRGMGKRGMGIQRWKTRPWPSSLTHCNITHR